MNGWMNEPQMPSMLHLVINIYVRSFIHFSSSSPSFSKLTINQANQKYILLKNTKSETNENKWMDKLLMFVICFILRL